MILNIALLFLVFGAEKKKLSPYVAALLLGLIKAVIYALFSRSIATAIIMGVIYASMAAALVYFLKRIDRREDGDRGEIPTYNSPGVEKMELGWEYIPLVILILLIIGGEALLR